jgi:peptide/nickel transport system permease protein
MMRYIARRLLLAIPVLWGAATIVFFVIRAVPGDIILAKMEGEFSANPAQLAQARAALGLDKPIYIQYFRWMGQLSHGDLGTSMNTFHPVARNIAERVPVTLELAILGLLFGILISLPCGILSAIFQDSLLDHVLRIGSIAALSVPSFVIATLILLFPALWWNYYPPLGYVNVWDEPVTNLKIMMPAAIAVGAILAGQSTRMTRAMMLEVIRSDYIRVARAKGLRDSVVILRHALRNALIPVVTLWGSSFAALLGGTVVVEIIFSLPGIGQLTLQAIQIRDYTQLQGNVLFFALVLVTFNLLTDLMYGVLDPQIRYA